MNVDDTKAGQLFDRFAETYDAGRRMLIPPFEAFYGTAVDVATARLADDRPVRVLDIGAGTGILTARLASARPLATFTLLDASSSMLEQAPRRLGADWSRCSVIVGDAIDALPDGRFDAVVTALAVHHLDDEGKRTLYGRVLERLRPGGVFVNAEQVAGPTLQLDAMNVDRWLEQTRALGATDQDHADAAIRMSMDLPASVEAQCGWLRDIGFIDVDCFFKQWRFAVFGGWRPAA